MNKTQEALKMAIEEAMKFVTTLNEYEDEIHSKPFKTLADKYISHASPMIKFLATSLQEALESQEKEPSFFGWYDNHDIHYEKQTDDSIPLYTNHAQPLSDDEINIIDNEIWAKTIDKKKPMGDFVYKFARAIEQALKEKNT